MNKLKRINLATLVLSSFFIAASVNGQIFSLANDAPAIASEINESRAIPQDFISQPLQNNFIDNQGNPNYQYQNLVAATDVNNPDLYNGQNVLSNQSLLTVRSEDFYFNFIKPTPLGEQFYRIVATPTDPYSTILPFSLLTNYEKINGSALWIKDRLVVIGTNASGNLLLNAYVVELSISENWVLRSTDSITVGVNNPQLANLQDVTTRQITERIPSEGNAGFIPYETYVNPIYMSPVTNFGPNTNAFKIVIWSASSFSNVFDPNSATPKPFVIVEYNNSGFIKDIKETTMTFQLPTELPILQVSESLNYNVTQQDILNSTVVALSPIIDEEGDFRIFTHSVLNHLNGQDNIGTAIITEISVTETTAENNSTIKQFSSNAINIGANGTIRSRDSMNYLPYGLFARGDITGTGPNNSLNLFFFFSSDIYSNTPGVGTNVVLDQNEQLTAPPEWQIQFFEANGYIFTNFLFVEQITYPNKVDINEGVKIGIRYRGVGFQKNITRIGTLTWQTPWNNNTWSQEAAIYGAGIITGYNASIDSISDGNLVNSIHIYDDLVPSIWNDTYSAVGIYEEKVAGQLRSEVKVLTRDLKTNLNVYNTKIPTSITVANNTLIDPNLIGINGLLDLIVPYSRDFPSSINEIEISSTQIIENSSTSVTGIVNNPYFQGTQSSSNPPLQFNTKILYPPTNAEISTPVILNNVQFKAYYPSEIAVFIDQTFVNKENPIFVDALIGTDNSNLVQIHESIVPFIDSLTTQVDDFLGRMTVDYEILASSGAFIEGSITINGFWGNVYIIPIVSGISILIVLIVVIVFISLRKRHESKVSLSFKSGYQLQKLRNKKKKKLSKRAQRKLEKANQKLETNQNLDNNQNAYQNDQPLAIERTSKLPTSASALKAQGFRNQPSSLSQTTRSITSSLPQTTRIISHLPQSSKSLTSQEQSVSSLKPAKSLLAEKQKVPQAARKSSRSKGF